MTSSSHGYIYIKRVMGFVRQHNVLVHAWQGYHKVGYSKDAHKRNIDGSLSHQSHLVATWEGEEHIMKRVEDAIHSKQSMLAPYNMKLNNDLTAGLRVRKKECYYFQQFTTPEECENALTIVIQGLVDTMHGNYVAPAVVSLPAADPDSGNEQSPTKRKRTSIQTLQPGSLPLLQSPLEWNVVLYDNEAQKILTEDENTAASNYLAHLRCFLHDLIISNHTQRKRAIATSADTFKTYADKSVIAALINMRRWFPNWSGEVHAITDDMFDVLKRNVTSLYYQPDVSSTAPNYTLEKWFGGWAGKGAGSMHAALKYVVQEQKDAYAHFVESCIPCNVFCVYISDNETPASSISFVYDAKQKDLFDMKTDSIGPLQFVLQISGGASHFPQQELTDNGVDIAVPYD